MKKTCLAISMVLAISMPFGGELIAGESNIKSGLPTGRYIFVLKDDFLGDVGVKSREVTRNNRAILKGVYSDAVRGFTLEATADVAASIARNNLAIEYFEPDLTVSLYDSFTPGPKANLTYGTQSQVTPWGVTRVGACASGTCDVPKNVRNPRVWIIDTGIADHPDLNIDRTRAFSSVGEGGFDANGHGTHVAGTIAAKNDGTGVVGVAPGAIVVPVQVISHDNQGSISTIVAGVNYVLSQRLICARTIGCEPQKWVVNMSLMTPASKALDRAVLNASRLGVRFAIAAGNLTEYAGQYSPARVNGTNIFTVSASCGPSSPQCIDKDYIASFSNFGNPPVDYAAPGDEVLSTYLSGSYEIGAGTSMATPHVAGLMARLPDLSTENKGRYYCGQLKGDKDRWPDPIAFLYRSNDFRCQQVIRLEPDSPREK